MMLQKDYYVISPNVWNDGNQEFFLNLMFQEEIVFMGWNEEEKGGKLFSNMKDGDIVIVAQGANWQKRLFFIGEVASESTKYLTNIGEVAQSRTLRNFIDIRDEQISFNTNCAYGESTQIPAIYQLKEDNSYDKVIMEEVSSLLKQNQEKQRMKRYINLLESNNNLILTGAPGTGKTYLAKQIASHLILGKPYNDQLSENELQRFNGQCEFVQFHPSYDYTDFVEGLRPIHNPGNNIIGFERKNGIFKSFCSDALENNVTYIDQLTIDGTTKKVKAKSLKTTNLEILYNHFRESNIQDVTKLKKDDFFEIIETSTLTEAKSIDYKYYQAIIQELLNAEDSQNSDFKSLYERLKMRICKKGSLSLSVNNRTYIATLTPKNSIGIVFTSNKELSNGSNEEDVQEDIKKYVFIIDEINRGEISKIIGELFFSIDPGFRGPKGSVKTQYQNLIHDMNDPFYKGFYVPDNVYIIGTMNDIDRSVESMDFAMRRRFAWKEISSSERINMWDGNIDSWKDEAQKRMTSLNKEIESMRGFNKAFHIGPAYFLKLEKYRGNFDLLWEYHIEGVLIEYLRGMSNSDDLLIKLKKAYDSRVNSPNENN